MIELDWYKGILNEASAGYLGIEFDIHIKDQRCFGVSNAIKRRNFIPGALRANIYFCCLKNDIQDRVLVASANMFKNVYPIRILTSQLASSIITMVEDEHGQPIPAEDPYKTLITQKSQRYVNLLNKDYQFDELISE